MQKWIKTVTKSRKRLLQVVVFVVSGSLGAAVLVQSQAATGTAVLLLNPTTATVSLDSTVSVTITEDSGTVSVNAVEADLSYDQTKLQFVSIDTSTSAFTLGAQATGGAGKVSIANATTTPVTGVQTVAKVNFTAIGSGTTTVGFTSSSGIAQSGDNTNVLGTATATTTYTIKDTTAPGVPTGLTSSNAAPTSTTINWLAPTDNVGVTGYKIYRGGTQIGTSTTPSYTSSGLAPSTAYSYTVAATDAAGNTSAQSTALSTSTTADTAAPTVPNNLALSTHTLTSVSLSWSASSDNVGVTGYKIYRGGTQIGTSTTPSYTSSGLAPGTSYGFTVASNDGAGNTSAQSAVGNFSSLADTAAPTIPTGLTSTSSTSTTISLSWSASSDNVGVTGYKIYRGGTQIGTSTTPSYTATGLVAGNNYSFTVATYDASGNTSAQSTAVSYATSLKLGDANNDGKVDYLDLSLLASSWLSTTDLRADFNHDTVINFLDLSILASNWGK